jgi:predicted transcriptional regulator
MEAESKRRDRHDIVAEILETARGGAIKTHIMYKARLSYAQVSEYVPLLLEKGFLENCTVKKHRQEKLLLKTTEQGEKFLENLKSLNLLWSG